MEFLLELLFELILEGSLSAARSEKVPKGTRVLLIALISLFVVGVLGGVLALAVFLLLRQGGKLELALGVLLIVLDGVMILSAIKKTRVLSKKRKEQKDAPLVREEKGEVNDER